MKVSKLLRHNPLNMLYVESGIPAAMRKILNVFLCGSILGCAHGLVCGGGTAAMVGLATSLGADDMVFGILTALPQVAMFLQIPFSALVNRTQKRKKYMLIYGIITRAIWLIIGLIPYIMPMSSAAVQLWTIVFLLGIASCTNAMINVCWFPWLSDLLPINIRGRWLSLRESVIAATNILFSLLFAFLLDTLPVESRYVVVFILGSLVGIVDLLCYIPHKYVASTPPASQSIFKVLRELVKNKPFVKFVIMWTAWCFSWNISAVYLTPYSLNVMGLTNMDITIFGTISCSLVAIIIMPRWGRMLDKFGSRNVMLVSCLISSVTQLFYLMASPGSIWPTLLFNVFGALFWCGCNLTATNMQISCSPADTRPTYIAIFACITAVVGTTLGSLTGGALLDAWHSAGTFDSWPIDRYQALIILAFILRIVLVLLLVPTFEKDSDAKPLDMITYIKRSIVFKLTGRFTLRKNRRV